MNATTNNLIDGIMESRLNNKNRRMNKSEKKSEVNFAKDIMVISLDMYIQCRSKNNHCCPLTFHLSKGKKSLTKGRHKRNIDRDENKIAILLHFITGFWTW